MATSLRSLLAVQTLRGLRVRLAESPSLAVEYRVPGAAPPTVLRMAHATSSDRTTTGVPLGVHWSRTQKRALSSEASQPTRSRLVPVHRARLRRQRTKRRPG